jgi:hypothetical protein
VRVNFWVVTMVFAIVTQCQPFLFQAGLQFVLVERGFLLIEHDCATMLDSLCRNAGLLCKPLCENVAEKGGEEGFRKQFLSLVG